MEVLNSGGDEASRQPCMGEHLQWAGHEGYLRWRLTRNGDRAWDMVNGTEGDDATWYRLECYVPAIDPEFGDLIRLQAFDAVTPQNLALVAIDDALAAVPTQDVRTSPADEAMVAIPTWFWVEGLPAEGVTATASVPGMTVTATASPGGVTFHLGDGATLDCDGQGVPYSPGATSDCTHEYQRAGYYPVTSTIRWTGTYQVNGSAPVPIESSVARTSSFDLPVNEAQALNTND